MSRKDIILACLTVLLNGAAQLLLRAAALRGASPDKPLTLITSPMFMTAIAAYGLSVLTWLAVLKRVPLAVATPFVAMVYVLVPVVSKLVFDDVITARMIGGMALVVTGVILVAAR